MRLFLYLKNWPTSPFLDQPWVDPVWDQPYGTSAPLCSNIWLSVIPLYLPFTLCLSFLQVNIDHETRELTRTNLKAAMANCFDVAQGKTRTLMEKDSYPRFLKSPAYRDLAAQASASSTSASSSSPAEPSHT